MVSREVPWAISRSASSSITNTSDRPTERPTWIACPPASSVAPIRAGRRKESDSSAVVYGVAGGSSVSIESPNAMSARMARAPPLIRPLEEASHGDAGILASAVPVPNPVGMAPVRWRSGGGGMMPRRQHSRRRRPGQAIRRGSG